MEKDFIFETPFWKVILMDDQRYLGRCVVIAQREVGDLADLNQEEILDFFDVVRKLEDLMKKAFDATMFNWSCLMNDAYLEPEPKPHVHWHMRPRYNHAVAFERESFLDPNFGYHYVRRGENDRIVEQALKEKIVSELKKNL
jgi:diadenosine tetraphosphate (Ap4A) HIT family hydrolase